MLMVAAVSLSLVNWAPASASATTCGVWRWPVKTLSDSAASQINYAPVSRTVDYLRGLKPPDHLMSTTPRQPGAEKTTLRVAVVLVRAKVEDDHDIHLVVADPKHKSDTMIVEFPDSSCNGAKDSKKKAEMASARKAITTACPPIGSSDFVALKGNATITGVGFFDEIHGQSGVAPNGIELHPALSFQGRCSAGSPSPSPSPSPPPSPAPSPSGYVKVDEIYYNSPGTDDGSDAVS